MIQLNDIKQNKTNVEKQDLALKVNVCTDTYAHMTFCGV